MVQIPRACLSLFLLNKAIWEDSSLNSYECYFCFDNSSKQKNTVIIWSQKGGCGKNKVHPWKIWNNKIFFHFFDIFGSKIRFKIYLAAKTLPKILIPILSVAKTTGTVPILIINRWLYYSPAAFFPWIYFIKFYKNFPIYNFSLIKQML